MAQVIIFEQANGIMAIVRPVKLSATMAEIAAKSVPQGVDYWVIDETGIPEDRTFRDSWEIDKSTVGVPDGKGGAIL